MTEVVRTRAALRDALAGAARPVGLVPTMGWLHEGHRALMRQARAADATTVVTIFVNPRQFTVADDYTKYPRDEARDLAIAEAEGVDIVFAPTRPRSIRPASTRSSRSAPWRSRSRAPRDPATSMAWRRSSPSCSTSSGRIDAYFGQKDAQQVMVIRQMARDLAIATQVIACPTVREPDGLALSSRNVHLTAEQRAAAPVLRRALLAARAAGRPANARPTRCATRCARR